MKVVCVYKHFVVIKRRVRDFICGCVKLCARGGGGAKRRNSVLLNLGREIEANVADILHFVLDHERDVGGEAERDVVGQRGRLGEEIEVAQCKGERDRLIELDRDCLIVVYSTFALAASDVACAKFTLCANVSPIVARSSVVPYRNRKLDTFLGHSNRDSVAQYGQITANALWRVEGQFSLSSRC